MIHLRNVFKRDRLHLQGTLLTKIVTKKLLSSNDVCQIDFDGILAIEPLFFQEFIFPLVIEFGSELLNERLDLLNLNSGLEAIYTEACKGISKYMDNIASRNNVSFGDISDITCELMIKAREVSRRDEMAAHAIFGIDKNMVSIIANMDIAMIRKISNAGLICFEPRFSPEFAERMAALDASEIDLFLNIAGQFEGLYD